MKKWENLGVLRLGFEWTVIFWLSIWLAVSQQASGLRPIREENRSWGDEWLFGRKQETEVGSLSTWNITGPYRGTWKFLDSVNSSSKFQDFRKANGNYVLELVRVPMKINGVHYVQANNSAFKVNVSLLKILSSQVFQESPRDRILKWKMSPINEMEKHCNIEIAAQISHVASTENNGDKNYYHMEGLMENHGVGDDGDCFSPLSLNTTSVNMEVYYNKAVNYTLMVTFVSFLQVLLLIRQMEHSNTQFGAVKVSIVMIGQQAIMDAYLCLLHLTIGILVESLFNAFATAAFFKFVVFSIFEMRYLLAIWKATRPYNSGEGWETMRRELSFLYSRFYRILLGGILIMYQFHNYMQPILLLMYSFWIPQIVANVVRDSRKPLHPYYILGMTVTRLAVPLYVFGCPQNFMRVEPSKVSCVCLCTFMGFQTVILLLQHYFGSRCFVPHQMLPEIYNYHRRFNQDVSRTTNCVICMTAIDLRQRTSDCMVTPCEHFFHSGCLERWMDIKMECPTFRHSLPPA